MVQQVHNTASAAWDAQWRDIAADWELIVGRIDSVLPLPAAPSLAAPCASPAGAVGGESDDDAAPRAVVGRAGSRFQSYARVYQLCEDDRCVPTTASGGTAVTAVEYTELRLGQDVRACVAASFIVVADALEHAAPFSGDGAAAHTAQQRRVVLWALAALGVARQRCALYGRVLRVHFKHLEQVVFGGGFCQRVVDRAARELFAAAGFSRLLFGAFAALFPPGDATDAMGAISRAVHWLVEIGVADAPAQLTDAVTPPWQRHAAGFVSALPRPLAAAHVAGLVAQINTVQRCGAALLDGHRDYHWRRLLHAVISTMLPPELLESLLVPLWDVVSQRGNGAGDGRELGLLIDTVGQLGFYAAALSAALVNVVRAALVDAVVVVAANDANPAGSIAAVTQLVAAARAAKAAPAAAAAGGSDDLRLITDGLISDAVRSATVDFVNRGDVQWAHHLALFWIDAAAASDGDAELCDGALRLVSLLADADAFVQHCVRRLAWRFLMDLDRNVDRSMDVLGQLHRALSAAALSPLAVLANELNRALFYDSECVASPVEPPAAAAAARPAFEYSCRCLSASLWCGHVAAPAALALSAMPAFTEGAPAAPLRSAIGWLAAVYCRTFSNRALQWPSLAGVVTLRARRSGGAAAAVTCSPLVAMVLLHFNRAAEWVVAELAAQFAPLSAAAFRRLLAAIAAAGLITVDGDAVRATDAAARSRLRLLSTVWLDSASVDAKQAGAAPAAPLAVSAEMLTQRLRLIEASIVRVMKARRQASHAELLDGVAAMLRDRFVVAPAAFKRGVREMLDREFIERAASSRDIYTYVA
jgi:hypothetical protein